MTYTIMSPLLQDQSSRLRHTFYKIASALPGDPIPLGSFSGVATKKNDHRLVSRQRSVSSSKSKNSPSARPNSGRIRRWSDRPPGRSESSRPPDYRSRARPDARSTETAPSPRRRAARRPLDSPRYAFGEPFPHEKIRATWLL